MFANLRKNFLIRLYFLNSLHILSDKQI